MLLSPFVPRFDDICSAESVSIKCVWNVKVSANGPQKQCSRSISLCGRAATLLQTLRGENSSSTAFQSALESLAELHLCGRSHRAKFTSLVVDQWKTQIRERNAALVAQNSDGKHTLRSTCQMQHDSKSRHASLQTSAYKTDSELPTSSTTADTTSPLSAATATAIPYLLPPSPAPDVSTMISATSGSTPNISNLAAPQISTSSSQKTGSSPHLSVSIPLSTLRSLTWQGSPSTLRRLLRIDEGDKIKCHSMRINGDRCRNPISKANRGHITSLIDNLSRLQSLSKQFEELVLRLAKLIMCVAAHQHSADLRYHDWIKLLESHLTSPKDAANSEFLTPPTSPLTRHTARESNAAEALTSRHTSSSAVSRVWSLASPDSISTPYTTPARQTAYKTPKSNPSPTRTRSSTIVNSLISDHELDSTFSSDKQRQPVNRVLFSAVSTNTRSSTSRTNFSTPSTQPTKIFIPYAKASYAPIIAAKKVLTCLLKPILSLREKDPGYIYIFERRSQSNGLYKVGTSKNVTSRMKNIRNACKYTPEVLYKIYVPHAFKVEQLVHCDLHLQRRKEDILHHGACNTGKGCPVVHKEWFEIELEKLKERIKIWVDFINSEPYDELFRLKASWLRATKLISLKSSTWSWSNWVDMMVEAQRSVVTVKVEPLSDGSPVYGSDSVVKVQSSINIKSDPTVSIKLEREVEISVSSALKSLPPAPTTISTSRSVILVEPDFQTLDETPREATLGTALDTYFVPEAAYVGIIAI